jgi:hypothetical protein
VASRLCPRLRPGELLTADRNLYSRDARDLAARTGAALLWRAPTQLELPVVAVLPDGSYLSVLVHPGIRRARRAAVIKAARAVKRSRHNNYRVKKPGEAASTRHDGPATIQIHHATTPRAA